jgi:hypothetical protein
MSEEKRKKSATAQIRPFCRELEFCIVGGHDCPVGNGYLTLVSSFRYCSALQQDWPSSRTTYFAHTTSMTTKLAGGDSSRRALYADTKFAYADVHRRRRREHCAYKAKFLVGYGGPKTRLRLH